MHDIIKNPVGISKRISLRNFEILLGLDKSDDGNFKKTVEFLYYLGMGYLIGIEGEDEIAGGPLKRII